MKAYETLKRTIHNADVIADSLERLVVGLAEQSDLIGRSFERLLDSRTELSNQRIGELQREAGRLAQQLTEQRDLALALQQQLAEQALKTGLHEQRLTQDRTETSALVQQFADQRGDILALRHQLAERQRQTALLVQQLGDHRADITTLQRQAAETRTLAATVGNHDAEIAALRQQAAETTALAATVGDHHADIATLQRQAAETVALAATVGDHHADIVALQRQAAETAALAATVGEQRVEIEALRQLIAVERSQRRRLETHDQIHADELRGIGGRIDHLQRQMLELSAYCDRVTAALIPPDVSGMRKRIAELAASNEPVPDAMQERSLRLELRGNPFDLGLTNALVGLLHRLGRSPMPEPPVPEADAAPEPEATGVAALLREAEGYEETGDTGYVQACLWQIVVRYPRSARGWAEYARHFAEQRDWESCRAAAAHVLSSPAPPDQPTASAALTALATLARCGEIGALNWADWLAALPAAMRAHPTAAEVLVWTGDRDGAAALLTAIARRGERDVDACVVAATIAYEAEQWDEAYRHWRQALEIDLPRALRAGVTDHSPRLSQVLEVTDRADELADWLSVESGKHRGLALVPPFPTRASECAAQALRDTAIARGLPSVMLVTQNQSASVSIGSLFNHGFGLVSVLYALIDQRVIAPWLDDYLQGGACFVTHLIPSERNIALLSAGGVKNVIVNVRDPRQWVVSNAGHNLKYPMMMPPSRRCSAGGMRQAIAAVIAADYERTLRWIDGWVEARARLNVEFTTYEEFVRDRGAFVDRILALYGGDRQYFDPQVAFVEKPGVDYHHRVGAIDEWRHILSRQQTEALNRMIPDRLWSLFGWEP